MEILRHIENRSIALSRPVLTMGNFDGIHLGHQALLRRVVDEARGRGGSSVVLTFEPHPLKVLAPERAPGLILTHKDKMRLLQSFGVDMVIIQAFDSAFANLEAKDFVQRYLIDKLKIQKIWVGRNFRFGKGRKGRVEDLVHWGKEWGFEVGVVDPIEKGDSRVSSSHIRKLLGQGKVREIFPLLGRYHFVSGRVVRGHQRGRRLGFPTANMVSQTEVLPLDGIYATVFQVDQHQWSSVTSVGHNPTFGGESKTIETYLFDFQGDLYGRPVRLFFVERIRAERKFASAELLVEQMKQDVLSAQKILSKVRITECVELGR